MRQVIHLQVSLTNSSSWRAPFCVYCHFFFLACLAFVVECFWPPSTRALQDTFPKRVNIFKWWRQVRLAYGQNRVQNWFFSCCLICGPVIAVVAAPRTFFPLLPGGCDVRATPHTASAAAGGSAGRWRSVGQSRTLSSSNSILFWWGGVSAPYNIFLCRLFHTQLSTPQLLLKWFFIILIITEQLPNVLDRRCIKTLTCVVFACERVWKIDQTKYTILTLSLKVTLLFKWVIVALNLEWCVWKV